MKRKFIVTLAILVSLAILQGCQKGSEGEVEGKYTVLAQSGRFLVGVWDCRFISPARNEISFVISAFRSAQISPSGSKEANKPTVSAMDIIPKDGDVPWWKIYEGKIKRYVGRDLFKYIDGGAELYHTYGFVEVVTAEYIQPKLATDSLITIDVYDMGTSQNAFGIYSQLRYPNAPFARFGNEAILTDETLDFWKDRFFIKIQAFEIATEIKEAMQRFARVMERRIPEMGNLPWILKSLPEEGRIKGSEQYFRQQLALNNIHYVSDENVLKLGGETEGIAAKYKIGSNKTEVYLFAIAYPDPVRAVEAFESYSNYLKGKLKPASVKPVGERYVAFNAQPPKRTE
ncbi:hypothetical protein J7M22_09065 [Candidatus Poribacteria bacterium]|nr:hypothetical protein [Candidatus Poribacteria bacterium]